MFIFILTIQFAYPQAPVKKLVAVRSLIAPKIDGVLDDDVWKNVPVATDFVENQPVAGRHESADNRTEIKIIYDDILKDTKQKTSYPLTLVITYFA